MLYYGLIVGVSATGLIWWRLISPAIKKRKEKRESLELKERERIERQRCRSMFTNEIAPHISISQRPDRTYEPISFVALIKLLEVGQDLEGGRVDTIQAQKSLDWAVRYSYLRKLSPGYYLPGPKLMELRKEKNA